MSRSNNIEPNGAIGLTLATIGQTLLLIYAITVDPQPSISRQDQPLFSELNGKFGPIIGLFFNSLFYEILQELKTQAGN